MLLLNRANKVLGITTIFKGGLSCTLMDVGMIFQYALKGNSSVIIIAQNHPSGNCNPSERYQKITQKIKEDGNLLDIQLLDHVFITHENEIFRS
jgi:DNA repair protein RadC